MISKVKFKFQSWKDCKKRKNNSKLLKQLNNLDLVPKSPKSLSREWISKHISLISENYKSQDILNTFCEHIGLQIGM